jgi:hypothetical protein
MTECPRHAFVSGEAVQRSIDLADEMLLFRAGAGVG